MKLGDVLHPIKVFHQDAKGHRTLLSSTGHGPWADAIIEEAQRKAETMNVKTGHLVLIDAANIEWEIPLESPQ